LALELEQKINPYCGYQDPYGCGIGGFKKMEFYRGGKVNYEFLPSEIFDEYDMHLIFTGVTRTSTDVLRSSYREHRKI
jgi:D-glycero-alpha-D-manno-heptose-7-phosphate kinase